MKDNFIVFIFEKFNNKRVPILITSFLILLFPIFLCFLPFIFLRINILLNFSFRMWISLVSVAIWLWLCPYFIYLFSLKYNIFIKKISKRHLKNNSFIDEYSKKLKNKLCTFDYISAMWIIIIDFILLSDMSYIKRFGTFGYNDGYLYVLLFCLSLIVYYTSIGLRGVVISIRTVICITKQKNLFIDFYNKDYSGGLSCIKEFSLCTTRLIMTGILFIPILLDYNYFTENLYVKSLIYILILAYAIFIFLSFYIPVNYTYKVLNKKKHAYFNLIMKQYRKQHLKNLKKKDYYSQLEEINLYNHLVYVKSISFYSFANSSVFIDVILPSLISPILGLILNAKDIENLLQTLFS